jgi:hypothetical protein
MTRPFLCLNRKAKQSQSLPIPMNSPYQNALRMIGEVRIPRLADPDVVANLPTFRAALRFAINHSGLDQEAIAESLEIDPACLSRMVKEPKHDGARPREFPHEKLSDFCRVTGCLAPLQWQDMRMGLEPVSARETRIQRLERELAEERARAVA